MLATYGLFDESNKGVSEKRRAEIIDELTALLDQDGDGTVKREEFADVLVGGKTLPDMGTGPGHHGDDEYEYEIHHWEKYVPLPLSVIQVGEKDWLTEAQVPRR